MERRQVNKDSQVRNDLTQPSQDRKIELGESDTDSFFVDDTGYLVGDKAIG